MQATPQNTPGGEDSDTNKQEPHDPVAAGRKANEAGRLANEKDKPAAQQEDEAKKDAEQWRNEG